jgi:hypothetical protein
VTGVEEQRERRGGGRVTSGGVEEREGREITTLTRDQEFAKPSTIYLGTLGKVVFNGYKVRFERPEDMDY